ncbi:MAG: hypothetical protein ACOYNY_32850, partial [Caldilineaceae bacterium]
MKTRNAILLTAVAAAIIMFGLGYFFGDRLAGPAEPAPIATVTVSTGGSDNPALPTFTATPLPAATTVDATATANALQTVVSAGVNATLTAQPPAPTVVPPTPIPITRQPTPDAAATTQAMAVAVQQAVVATLTAVPTPTPVIATSTPGGPATETPFATPTWTPVA